MNIKIITDSCSDLPEEIVEKYKITVIPLEIRFKDETYIDGIDLKSDDFFDMLKKSDELPKTASPSPEQFL
ncbi:MAG: DegV family protein, partial [Tissierellaceae bacterium]